ncbi:prephenate dehydrogenase [Williamsia maris]|uniref:Prephenate dehydrogenase n=1 Tax=Williamsia maris TaxID=72806 RepID=A0ABT1HFJ2_9NOCA|nr:prephenate dehydrogenase [Williamsia maris]MCP2175740.1 prephenate dehydrogenase [Williamsia maris]
MSANDSICVLGLGLIGGSLLRAATAAGRVGFGYNRSLATVDEARAAGFDADGDLDAVLARAAAQDALIVIATPVTALDPILDAIVRCAPNCALTDVISVKAVVAQAVAAHGLSTRYVGGHPMAGTAESGWAATDPALFTGATWVVGTDDGVDPHVWQSVSALAGDVGAVVVPVATDDHDRAVAAISHLPHLTAAVTAAVGGGEGALALRLAAGSFRDGTRVAGTAVPLQRAMLEANAPALLITLSETIDRLTRARDDLRNHGSVQVVADNGHRARLRYEEMAGDEPDPIVEVEIGAPGWTGDLRHQAHLGRVWRGVQTRSASPE